MHARRLSPFPDRDSMLGVALDLSTHDIDVMRFLSGQEVERVSELCRGRTVVDLWLRTGRPANAHVGVDLDAEAFFDLLVERITSLG